jgi:hypothetical protein
MEYHQAYEILRGDIERYYTITGAVSSSAPKFGGKFEFTAANLKDPSKTIQVSGSFQNASLP